MNIKSTLLKSYIGFVVAFALIAISARAQTAINANVEHTMKSYSKVSNGYIMVLKQHQNLFDELERLATDEKIPSANFTGMGFVNITFGYFNFGTKEYQPGDYSNVELASMHGSIAWKEGRPSVHAHGVVGDQKFEAHAGHILKATVSTGSLEIMVTVHDKQFERRRDERLGADVLDITSH
jgi:uncharacterized protein